jgi:hypothetical protein
MAKRLSIAMICAACVSVSCCSGGSKTTAPTTTTITVAITAPPTTRVLSLCAKDARLVVNYIVGGELHGKLPLGGVVPAAQFAKPEFRTLLSASLNDCTSQAEWHTAMQDYVDGGTDQLTPIFQRGCELERVANACHGASN